MQNKLNKILERNIVEVITKDELEKKLKSGKKLRIKFGVDVTSPLLHLGHAVSIWKMREFQELGHKVIFLIGDFTTLIGGDPTGRINARPRITKEQIEKDAKEYQKQATKMLLDAPEVFEVRRNSEWYDKMAVKEFLELASRITHARLIERDMFQERIKSGKEIYMNEILYPLIQGYDSVMLESDMTVVGEDQLFNEMVGRTYQKIFGQEPQVILTVPIIPGLDGKEKMSKSLGNYIAILDTPRDKFGKIMSIPDELIIPYFKNCTRLALDEIAKIEKELKTGLNPFEAKKRLAYEIVKLYNGESAAEEELKFFVKTFSKGEIEKEKLPKKIIKSAGEKLDIIEFIEKIEPTLSRSKIRQLIVQKGITINNKAVESSEKTIEPAKEIVVRIGKKKFYLVELTN